MSKKHKQPKRPQKPKVELRLNPESSPTGDPRESNRSGRLSLILDWVAIVFSIFGMLLCIPSFRPLVQVSNHNYFDPHDPFSAPFSVVNNGLFTVYNVELSCFAYRV